MYGRNLFDVGKRRRSGTDETGKPFPVAAVIGMVYLCELSERGRYLPFSRTATEPQDFIVIHVPPSYTMADLITMAEGSEKLLTL